MIRLHLCCGDVYLKGYVNIDRVGVPPPKGYKGTTLDKYFKGKTIKKRGKVYVDRLQDIASYYNCAKGWGYECNSIDEIVMINGIEHFDLFEARGIIRDIKTILKPNGKFLVDFPDIGNIGMMADKEWQVRLLYGSETNPHKWGYTKDTFLKLLGNGWNVKFRDIVKHDYPSTGVEATKK